MSLSEALKVVGILLTFTAAVPLAKSAAHQQNLTRRELKALIASAKTAADHERIAAYYRAKARQLEVKYWEHEEDLAARGNSEMAGAKHVTLEMF